MTRGVLHCLALVGTFFVVLPLAFSGEKEKVTLNVKGMHCNSCASMIRKTVRKVPGVEEVVVNVGPGTVEVQCDSGATRRQAVVHAIERMGYEVANDDSATDAQASPSEQPHH